MINPIHVIQGYLNDAIKTNNWEKVSALRMKICNDCPKIDKTGEHCKTKGMQPCCSLCGCPLSKKTRSNSKCPINKW